MKALFTVVLCLTMLLTNAQDSIVVPPVVLPEMAINMDIDYGRKMERMMENAAMHPSGSLVKNIFSPKIILYFPGTYNHSPDTALSINEAVGFCNLFLTHQALLIDGYNVIEAKGLFVSVVTVRRTFLFFGRLKARTHLMSKKRLFKKARRNVVQIFDYIY